MRLGVTLPQARQYDPARDVTEFARAAEEIGFDSLWAYERILSPEDTSGEHGLYNIPDLPWPESYSHVADALVTLTLAAAVTRRVELGTGVLVPGLHLPLRLARSLATLDAAAGGRVIAGLGSGWSIDEFQATAPRPIAERGRALDEFLDIAEAVWGPDPVSYRNDRYRLAPSRVNPKPARRVPIYLAGSNRTALGRIARRADGWLPTAIAPQRVGPVLADLRARAAEAGRDPAGIGCVFQVAVRSLAEVPSQGRQPYAGSVKQVVEDIAALAEAGVEHVYVTLASAAGDLSELIDAAQTLHTEVRAAGL
ncbi:TIGR03619 family F420-dependent LLM class oxidoreductase [Actinoplanes regularis]|uniref:Probable F420-dependent oxidoreductase, Rv2161c family n=1 Tax=Actinoplanes regularis TaxID=52697 RepID=A0A239FZJ7_9ACTN|nr:TIGR03619 family F420-dependent LLM class oxidoreductase [Actinoplanes regularis]GIE90061.1 LLM class F420-dependent oxidoreductase [Actinoplanes regularis]SNS62299.1 probable F420-dependent oxidoreductase, Rv2161c family [Actinoplanes regularis]